MAGGQQLTPLGWRRPDLFAPTTFLMVRHGETALTAQRRFSGVRTDPELSETGRDQIERLAAALDRLGVGPVHSVLSSPLRRARQSADILARTLGLSVGIDQRLVECDFGEWEGLRWAEIERGWPAELSAWLASTAVAPPGGESFDTVAARVRQLRDELPPAQPGRTVLLVSHVSPIKLLVSLALAAPVGSIYRMELSAASVTVAQWFQDGQTSLRCYNDTSHLR
ncbi:MAG: histidine phosphatase family protein [Sporichthyaceae bacterium]|nr:histidine phosphatase family protein [Sporichthyaceae bacterium]